MELFGSYGLWRACGWLCHQLPERSPHFGEYVFPFCARCAGIQLGLLASYFWLLLSGGLSRRLPPLVTGLAVAFFCAPMLIDGWGNALGAWSSPDLARALGGLCCGVMLPVFAVPLAQKSSDAAGLKTTLNSPEPILVPLLFGIALLVPVLRPFSLPLFEALGVAAGIAPLALALNLGVAFLRGGREPWVELLTCFQTGDAARLIRRERDSV
jgi:uncharacterized membrane protein